MNGVKKSADFSHLSAEDCCTRALDAAAKQLSYRAMSCKGLLDKLLEKGYPDEAAEYAVAWLSARGLLDDDAFADSVTRSYQRRGYGPRRIRQELKRRGVPREQAEDALEDFTVNDEKMRAIIEKRLHSDLSDRKEVNKAVAALGRRGYEWDDIRRALQAYGAAIEEQFD